MYKYDVADMHNTDMHNPKIRTEAVAFNISYYYYYCKHTVSVAP